MTKLKLASRLYNFDMWAPSSIEEIRPGTTVDIHVSAKESHDFEYDLVTDEINFELISMDLQVSKNSEISECQNHQICKSASPSTSYRYTEIIISIIDVNSQALPLIFLNRDFRDLSVGCGLYFTSNV